MRTEPVSFETFRIYDAPKLDPITVIMQDVGPGNGRLIIECYSEAWAAWWGAMGDRTVRQFILDCDPGYIVNRMRRPRGDGKRREDYMRRIVVAVQDALRGAHQTSGPPEWLKPTTQEAVNELFARRKFNEPQS